MNLPETTTPMNAREEQESVLLLPPLESFLESPESMDVLLATDEATKNLHGKGSGLRVLRASPLVLAFCGIVFISLIFLMDFTTLRPNRAATVSRTSSASPAETVTLPRSSERDRKDLANAPAVAANAPAAAQPSVAPAVQSPSVQPAPAAPPADQTAMQQPAPAPLKTNEPKPAQVNAPLAAEAEGEGGFTLQVGSFNNQGEANERVAKLSGQGVRAYAVRVEIPKRGTWYRVQVGRFMNREEAGRYGTQLRGRGAVADFIVTERRAT